MPRLASKEAIAVANSHPGTHKRNGVPSYASRRRDQILITRVGLDVPDDLTYEEWKQAGVKLGRIANTSAWCLGDWLAHGQNKYGEKYRSAIEHAGLDYQTLRNYAWVAKKFNICRRRDNLSFQHHAEVASLNIGEQDKLLSLAEKHNWSRNELRRQIKGIRRDPRPSDGALVPRLSVAQEHLKLWQAAAEVSSSSLESWLVATLNAAAAEVLNAADSETVLERH